MSKKDRCLFESESQKTLRKTNEELEAKLVQNEKFLKSSHEKINILNKEQTERDLAMIAAGYLPLRMLFDMRVDVQVISEYAGYTPGPLTKFQFEARTMDGTTSRALFDSLKNYRG